VSTIAEVDGAVEEREARASDTGHVAVTLLGSFGVHGRSTTLGARELGGGKPRQIFTILALHAGQTVSKWRLVESLWPDRAPADALATLESYVSVLRSRLLPVCHGRTDIIRTAVSGYTIDRDRLDLDLDRFACLVARATGAEPAVAYGLLREALALAEAPLLVEDAASGWADDVRRAHAHRVASAQVAAAQAAAALGRTEEALYLAELALVAEPHSEAAWEARITTLEGAGRHADALRVYGECRTAFVDELGCPPGPALQRALRRLLSGLSTSDEDLGELLVALLRVRDYVTSTEVLHERQSSVAGAVIGRPMSAPVQEAFQTLEELLVRARPLRLAGLRHRPTG
jgi:DNA-binding SARP family transcriptional activator